MATLNLLLLPGDGIGPEVMAEVSRVVDWFNARANVTGTNFEIEHGLVGGAAIDTEGIRSATKPLPRRKPPTQSCWARSAAPNGTVCRSNKNPNAAFCACARILSCSPICVRPCVIRPWRTHPRSSANWSRVSTS